MTRANLEHAQRLLRRALRHPLTLVLLPMALLAASRIGGEPALVAAAVALPGIVGLVFAGRRHAGRGAETALPGAVAFGTYLSRALSAGTRARTACLLIATDRAGAARPADQNDRFLQILARRIQPALREDDVIASLDRTTLAIALSPGARLTVETLIQTALRLQRRLDLPADPGAGPVGADIRIGVALSAECDTPALLLGRARAALAATAPGAIGSADPGVAGDALLAVDLARDLPGAFADGQIVAFFQPQTCAETGALTGVEALARWQHPRHGLLNPGQFMTTVEAAEMMGDLTETMLANALRALGDWDRIGLHVPRVSVNFSLGDLSDPALVERIAWLLDAADIAPERLGIEVLKSVLNLNDAVVSQTLWRLREFGCYIDLDDFGTGNTSIANIRRFAIERLKIDRSFVRRIDRDGEQRGMVSAILTMAAQLKIDTLAEGVETPEEHAILSQLGCRHVQGFGIARPMPQDRIPLWLAERSRPEPPAPLREALQARPPAAGAPPCARRAGLSRTHLAPHRAAPRRLGGRGKTA